MTFLFPLSPGYKYFTKKLHFKSSLGKLVKLMLRWKIFDEKVASSKKHTLFMTKIDTLFITKTVENPTLWGRTSFY